MVVNLEFYYIALVVILLSPQHVMQKWEWEELSCKGWQLEAGGHARLFARSAVHGFPVLVRGWASLSGLDGCADDNFIHRGCHAKVKVNTSGLGSCSIDSLIQRMCYAKAKAGGYMWQ